MQFDLRLGNIFDQMIVKAAGFFQVIASAVRTTRETNVVINRVLVGHRRCAKHAGMLAVRFLAAVGFFARGLRSVGFGCALLAAPLQFGFQFGDPRIAFSQLPTQERDFLEQIVNLLSPFSHHPRSVPSNPILGKMDSLNSYV